MLSGPRPAWEAGPSRELTVAVGEQPVLLAAGRGVRGQARDRPAEHLLVRRLQDRGSAVSGRPAPGSARTPFPTPKRGDRAHARHAALNQPKRSCELSRARFRGSGATGGSWVLCRVGRGTLPPGGAAVWRMAPTRHRKEQPRPCAPGVRRRDRPSAASPLSAGGEGLSALHGGPWDRPETNS